MVLSEKLRYKENEIVRATLAEPVFSFDRQVIPRGSQLEGTITALGKPGKWTRISALLGGNFTPPRVPQITFSYADSRRRQANFDLRRMWLRERTAWSDPIKSL